MSRSAAFDSFMHASGSLAPFSSVDVSCAHSRLFVAAVEETGASDRIDESFFQETLRGAPVLRGAFRPVGDDFLNVQRALAWKTPLLVSGFAEELDALCFDFPDEGILVAEIAGVKTNLLNARVHFAKRRSNLVQIQSSFALVIQYWTNSSGCMVGFVDRLIEPIIQL
jgi:hypothetical protein